MASCAVDAECPFGQVCQSGTCVEGCYTTSNCPFQPSPTQSEPACVGANLGVSPPVLGNCQPFCLSNDSCPPDSFCDTASGTCSSSAGDTNCADCGQDSDCGPASSCLQFIISGQTALFCGSTCTSDADCPGGFSCNPVIYGCSGPGDPGCQPPGDVQCTLFNPVNESPSYFCAGPDGQPYQYFSACSPLSGYCPASSYP